MKPITPASPHAIIMVGIPGSGKSTFAEHFADTFKAPILNESKLAYEANIDAERAEFIFNTMIIEIMKANRTFIVEADNLTKTKRAALTATVSKAGYRPLIVWVQTEPVEARRRALKQRPIGSGLSDSEFESAVRSFAPPLPQEKPTVISGKHTYATQIKVVLKQLAGSRPDTPLEPPRPRPTGNITVR